MAMIRRMREADAGAVSTLLAGSWKRTYAPIIGHERVSQASVTRHSPAKLSAELHDPDIMAFVAEDNEGTVIGHAMARMDRNRDVWLERLHVLPALFGSGLATDLLHAVLAAHAGLPLIALEVIKGNDRAIAFYAKHGFLIAEEKESCGDMADTPTLVMRKILPRA